MSLRQHVPPALRIALVEFYGVGGTADYTDCLAQALTARGHDVAVVSSSLFQPIEDVPSFRIMRVFRYRTSEPKVRKAFKLAGSLGTTREVLRKFQPDVVHAQGTVMPVVERSLYRGLRPAVRVCTVHDVEGHERRPWLGSFAGFYAGFDALICHSSASQQRMRAVLPGVPVSMIPHGRYTPLAVHQQQRSKARSLLQLPEDARIVLMFGFIRPYKGLDLFLDAVGLAAQSDPTVLGVVAGRPLYDISASRRAADRRGIPMRWDLRFIPRDNLASYFAAADVVALPYVETSDSGVIELAAAFGRPVVVTSAGGMAEAFERYGVGRLVPPADAAALADAMLGSYDPTAGSPVVNSWEDAATRTEYLYRDLLAGTAWPANAEAG
jgi:D-inositol-3-phosphate glycosyltransferase